MPPYPWLLSWELDVETAPARLKALQRVGVPYSDEQIARAITDAQAQADEIATGVAATGGPADLQDKEIVALVAYLQRLGTDLYR
jgi:cytochrome c oxidase cbb3-type subunit I/II